MKTNFAMAGVAALMLVAAVPARAKIIAGPIVNPSNGHEYYLLAPDTWIGAEAEAESLGGTLAVIRNAGEQEWLFATFCPEDDSHRNLWIGLHRKAPGGPFAWVTDEPFEYTHWAPGQPDNAGGVENCVHIRYPRAEGGYWNDLPDAGRFGGDTPCGVVEIPGKSRAASLTRAERSLIGAWYESGRADRPCWITGTDDRLFVIGTDQHASRAIPTAEGRLFHAEHRRGIYGEILKDRILWSNGTWWSRAPAKYEAETRPDSESSRITAEK